MGGDDNRVHIISSGGVESLDEMPKHEVAMAFDASMRRTSKVLFNAVLLRAHAHNTFATSALEM